MTIYIIRPSIAIKKEYEKNGDMLVYFYINPGKTELKIKILQNNIDSFNDVINKPVEFPIAKHRPESKFIGELVDFLLLRDILVEKSREDWMDIDSFKCFDRQLRLLSDKLPVDIKPKHVQKKINASKVLVIGIGGVGSNIIQQLTFMGVKNFCLIDPDTVDVTNLNRQPLYLFSDIGEKKVEKAKEWICKRYHDSIVDTYSLDLDDAIKEGIINKYCPDIIINCADKPSIYETTNSIIKHLTVSTPVLVGGGYFLFKSFVGPLIIPGETACLCCNTSISNRSLQNISASGGNIMAVASIAASLSCATIMRLFMNEDEKNHLPLCNKQVEIDLELLSLNTRELKRDAACTVCGHFK